MRIYAAQAAAITADTAILYRLAQDTDNNVWEAAITGLSKVVKHGGDVLYIRALSSPGYQVVLAAATALEGSTGPQALPALLDNLDRLTQEKRENSHDPRAALLKRISEQGSAANASRITPYLADFDTVVAVAADSTLAKWGAPHPAAHPMRLPIREEPLAQVFLAPKIELRVTMANGGRYTIRLFNNETPATVARIVRLTREHFYDGHVFQRVEPNFVVQGGGPDANEYVGDGPFMRDEIAWRSHLRGTLGVSGRGRDTGDAQWFFNLTDNTRLDHEYTVFGEVTAGRDVVERIVEGDRIARVEVVW